MKKKGLSHVRQALFLHAFMHKVTDRERFIAWLRFRRGRPNVKNNIVYILCKDILYTLCKHIVYKFLLIEALIFLLNEDRCESDKPVSSGILAYLRQSSR